MAAKTIKISSDSFLGAVVIAKSKLVSFYVPDALVNELFNPKECLVVKKQLDALDSTWANVCVLLGPRFETIGLLDSNQFDESFLNNVDEFQFIWEIKVGGRSQILQKSTPARFYNDAAFDVALCCLLPFRFSYDLEFTIQNLTQGVSIIQKFQIIYEEKPPNIDFIFPTDEIMNKFQSITSNLAKYVESNPELRIYYNTSFDYFEANKPNLLDWIVFYCENESLYETFNDNSFTFDQSVSLLIYRIMQQVLGNNPSKISLKNSNLKDSQTIDEKYTNDSKHVFYVRNDVFHDLNINEIFKGSQANPLPAWIQKKTTSLSFTPVLLFSVNTRDSHQIAGITIGAQPIAILHPLTTPQLKIIQKPTKYRSPLKNYNGVLCNNNALLYYNRNYTCKSSPSLEYVWINDKQYKVLRNGQMSLMYAVTRFLYMTAFEYSTQRFIPQNLKSVVTFYNDNNKMLTILTTQTNTDFKLFKTNNDVTNCLIETMKFFGIDKDDDFMRIFGKIRKLLNTNITVIFPEVLRDEKQVYVANPCFYSDTDYDSIVDVPSAVFIYNNEFVFEIEGDFTDLLNPKLNLPIRAFSFSEVIGLSTNAQEDISALEDVLDTSLLWNNIQFSASVWKRQFSDKVSSTLPVFELCDLSFTKDLFMNPISWFTHSNEVLNCKPLFIKWNKILPLTDVCISEYNTYTKNEILGKAVLIGYIKITDPRALFTPESCTFSLRRNNDNLIKSHPYVVSKSDYSQQIENYLGVYSCIFNVGNLGLQHENKILEKFGETLKNVERVFIDPKPLAQRTFDLKSPKILTVNITATATQEYKNLQDEIAKYNTKKQAFDKDISDYDNRVFGFSGNPRNNPAYIKLIGSDRDDILKKLNKFKENYEHYLDLDPPNYQFTLLL